MSEDVYVLNKAIEQPVLEILNSNQLEDKIDTEMLCDAIEAINIWPDLDQVENWIAALKSGKKIINPLSPKEELEKTFKAAASYHEVSYCEGYKTGIETALSIISKEHPDVADWLGGDGS